ncbi:MAG: hypothetical protein PVG22_17325 [Chromatiales bacterium]
MTDSLSVEQLRQRCPPWVRWLAQDQNGAWWGYEHEPNEGDISWYENEVGRYLLLGKGTPNQNWRRALHRL